MARTVFFSFQRLQGRCQSVPFPPLPSSLFHPIRNPNPRSALHPSFSMGQVLTSCRGSVKETYFPTTASLTLLVFFLTVCLTTLTLCLLTAVLERGILSLLWRGAHVPCPLHNNSCFRVPFLLSNICFLSPRFLHSNRPQTCLHNDPQLDPHIRTVVVGVGATACVENAEVRGVSPCL